MKAKGGLPECQVDYAGIVKMITPFSFPVDPVGQRAVVYIFAYSRRGLRHFRLDVCFGDGIIILARIRPSLGDRDDQTHGCKGQTVTIQAVTTRSVFWTLRA